MTFAEFGPKVSESATYVNHVNQSPGTITVVVWSYSRRNGRPRVAFGDDKGKISVWVLPKFGRPWLNCSDVD